MKPWIAKFHSTSSILFTVLIVIISRLRWDRTTHTVSPKRAFSPPKLIVRDTFTSLLLVGDCSQLNMLHSVLTQPGAGGAWKARLHALFAHILRRVGRQDRAVRTLQISMRTASVWSMTCTAVIFSLINYDRNPANIDASCNVTKSPNLISHSLW